MGDDHTIRLVAREISNYLIERPDAADTADGILRWWLPQRRIDATKDDVRRALDLLSAEGVVEGRTLPDGRTVFGRGSGRRRDD